MEESHLKVKAPAHRLCLEPDKPALFVRKESGQANQIVWHEMSGLGNEEFVSLIINRLTDALDIYGYSLCIYIVRIALSQQVPYS
jgi:hypothetical protein